MRYLWQTIVNKKSILWLHSLTNRAETFPFIFFMWRNLCGSRRRSEALFLRTAWAKRDRMVVYGSTETWTCWCRDGRPHLRAELWLRETLGIVPRYCSPCRQYSGFTVCFKMYEIFASWCLQCIWIYCSLTAVFGCVWSQTTCSIQ